jgi:hypothetical protein
MKTGWFNSVHFWQRGCFDSDDDDDDDDGEDYIIY